MRPGPTPRTFITALPSSAGRIFASSSCSRQLRDPRLELVHAAGERRGLPRVPRRAVATRQLVEVVEQRTRVAHVAADRAVGPAHPVRVEPQVQLDELGDVVDDVVRVPQRHAGVGGPSARRRRRGSGTSRLAARSQRVPGLPTSCSSAESRSFSRGDVFATTAIVCASTSLCRWIGSCSSSIALSSGRNSSASLVRAINQSPADGSSATQQLRQLVADALRADDLAGARASARPRARGRHRARSRASRRSAPRGACAAGRRRTRSPARAACAAGAAARSARPPCGSISSGSSSAIAIALMVKSRRDRSVSMSSENVTSGLRLSSRYISARKVVISNRSPSFSAARRCRTARPGATPRRPSPSPGCSITRRPGVGRDVDVGIGADPVEERVAHAAAHEVGPVAGPGEAPRQLL